MAKLRLGIDKYHPDENGNVTVRLEFVSKSKMAPYALDVKINPNNWDDKYKTILPTEPRFKSKNKIIDTLFEKYNDKYENLYAIGKLPINAYKMSDVITKEKTDITFLEYFEEVISTIRNKTTRSIYQTTYNIIVEKYSNKLYF